MAAGPLGRLRARVHGFLRQLLGEHTEPGRLALGVFVGVVIGCSPLFGLHLPICVLVALLLGLNQFVVYGAANVSIPPLVPLIAFSSLQLGERLRHGRWLTLHLGEIGWREAPALAARFFVDWLLGGLVVGAAVGAVAATVVYVIVRARRRTRDVLAQLLDEAARRYRGLPPRLSIYARMKYRMDPCYRAIVPLIPDGAYVVDLGTGLGMLPVAIALAGGGRRALGIEWDEVKLAGGRHAARELPAVELRPGDVRAAELPACDAITLVDVLHYYDADAQRALLARCKAALRPGGRLLVRDGDADRRGGARVTRVLEWLATRLGWNRGPRVRFRPGRELRADLEHLGFAVRVDDVAGQLHPGNILLIADLPP